MNQNFSANRGPYLQCFSWLKHWTKRFCADFSRWVVNRMQVITNKIHQNTLIKGIRIFFPENSTDFVFQKLPEEIQSKIVYFYSVINEYSLRSRDMTLPAILLTKMIRFWKRLWCLAIVVRTRTEFSSLNYSFVVLWSWRVRQTPQEARVVKPWH